jgi:hypothetical protein
MLIERIMAERSWSEFIVIRMFRRWAAARDAERSPVASLVELATGLGESAVLAVAFDSLFQLTEACLGRHLLAECCCSPALSPDERALLLMIAAAPAPGGPATCAAIPHGLPGALAWAAASLKSLLGDRLEVGAAWQAMRCPFSPD